MIILVRSCLLSHSVWVTVSLSQQPLLACMKYILLCTLWLAPFFSCSSSPASLHHPSHCLFILFYLSPSVISTFSCADMPALSSRQSLLTCFNTVSILFIPPSRSDPFSKSLITQFLAWLHLLHFPSLLSFLSSPLAPTLLTLFLDLYHVPSPILLSSSNGLRLCHYYKVLHWVF